MHKEENKNVHASLQRAEQQMAEMEKLIPKNTPKSSSPPKPGWRPWDDHESLSYILMKNHYISYSFLIFCIGAAFKFNIFLLKDRFKSIKNF